MCNQNRIHCTKLEEVISTNCSQDDGGALEEINPNCDQFNTIKTFACSPMQRNHTEDDANEKEVPSSVDIENGFLYHYMDIDETSRLSVGHQSDEMIKFCAFKGKRCPQGWVSALHLVKILTNNLTFRIWKTISSSQYGNCFTFNSLVSDADDDLGLTSLLPGPNLGLTLVIDLQQPFYMQNGLTTSAGIRVTIHDPKFRLDLRR